MSNHPNPDAPGNVKLWRCNMARVCHVSPCVHKEDVPSHCVPSCAEEVPCLSSGLPSRCEIVGFRTPSQCEDCEHENTKGVYSGPCSRCGDRNNYSPRLPTTAEDDLVKLAVEDRYRNWTRLPGKGETK